jgi:hypothetical protein
MKQPRRALLLRTVLAFLIGWLTSLPAVKADSWAPPTARVFASERGNHGLKVVPPSRFSHATRHKAAATLFTLEPRSGAEKIEWQAALVNVPHRGFVSSADGPPFVVTVDTWGNLGHAHSLVVYGWGGRVVADFALEDLLTPGEMSKVKRTAPRAGGPNGPRSVSHRTVRGSLSVWTGARSSPSTCEAARSSRRAGKWTAAAAPTQPPNHRFV